ncbi:hypothetical protein ACNOYE_34875 [Nannocystaceae bacterium ST9]
MAKDDVNWMVPLRRAVVKKALSYHDFLADWLEQLRDTDNSFVLATWYNDPKVEEFTLDAYNAGIVALRRWLKATFGKGYKVTTSSVGFTTAQTDGPNFHARLWKGPKRILLEQRAKDDPAKLAELQPFDLKGGRIELQFEDKKPKAIQLLPGDVLEIPLHQFLSACGQKRFDDVEFDPKGSFYLGTTVRSATGRKRTDLPPLHDNMLAMRFQLITALNMANCYHDEPVYTAEYMATINKAQIKPEGAGLFARGMPFGGNSSSTVEPGPLHWMLYQPNTNQPELDRPIYMPARTDLDHYAEKLPLSWGWTCTPFILFFFTLLADGHQDQDGVVFPNEFRSESLATSLCLSTDKDNNTAMLNTVTVFQSKSGANLLLHGLDPSRTQVPREQPPLADLCEVVFPADRGAPQGRPFADPNGDRIKQLALPAPNGIDTYEWNDICPDASVVVVSSQDGHEFGLVKLYKADKIFRDAVEAISSGGVAKPPLAGRMSAYNPLSGEDYCAGGSMKDGHFFVTESAASMPPANRSAYYSLKVAGVKIHKFRPTPANEVRFQFHVPKKKKGEEEKEGSELRIDESGGKFRKKRVSGIFYLREGSSSNPDPRTLWNIYQIPRESWMPVSLRFTSKIGSKEEKRLLDDVEKLYGERAVPFPAILEVTSGLPSRERAREQLDNHHRRLVDIGEPDAAAKIKAEIDAETSKWERLKLEGDLKLTEVDKLGNRKWEMLRKALIALVSGSNGAGDDSE